MKVSFWGVRGSIPISGVTTKKYGGNTSCISISSDNSDSLIILDAGTGIRELGQTIIHDNTVKNIHIFFTHAHWDHIQGLVYFEPLYRSGYKITIYSPVKEGKSIERILDTVFGDAFSRLSRNDWNADVRIIEFDDSTALTIKGGYTISSSPLNHPWDADAYRIEHNGNVCVYVTDTAPFDHLILGHEFIGKSPDLSTLPVSGEIASLEKMKSGLINLCNNADLIVYDTMFLSDDYNRNPHWGHSTPEHAIEICKKVNADHLVLFHHAPERTDEMLDQMSEKYSLSRNPLITVARENTSVFITKSGEQ
ncbi:MAG: MBL fold metallo-hydrolase [Deltaproteobacteria bacterium]|nr:MBL fold metallo-hydrolase [Deltaproteobacteria bacterium]